MREDWIAHPIERSELPPVEILRHLRDFFDDFEPDDAYDESDYR